MRVRVVLGIVCLLVGTVWFFQGIGTLEGSFMTDQTEWLVIGAIVDLVGAALLLGAMRERRDAADDV